MRPETGQVVIILIVLFVRLVAAALARVFRPVLCKIGQSLSEGTAPGETPGRQRQKRA